MALKDWKKTKNKADVLVFRTKATKDYNQGQPEHLKVGEKYRIFSVNAITIMKQWYSKDLPERDEKKAVWKVSDMNSTISEIFKTKSQAIRFAKNYMKSH